MGRGTLGRGGASGRSGGAARGGGLVELSPEAQKTILDLARQAAPVTVGVLDDDMGQLERKAYELWPVKTGYSKSTMALKVGSKRGAFVYSLVVGAAYAYYVRSKKLGKNAAKALVLDPAVELADRLATKIGEGLARGNR